MRIFGMSLGLALLAGPALADVTGRFETVDEDALIDMEMTIEADDVGNVRMQMAGSSGYYLLLDGELFIVQRDADGSLVMRLSDAMTISLETADRMGASDLFKSAKDELPDWDLAPMGDVTVGNRQGVAYGVRPNPGEEPVHELMVISSDPQLAPLGQAIMRAQEASLNGMGQFRAILAQVSGELSAAIEKGAPLRMMQIELTDVSFDTIPAGRFELPAEPLTIEQLREQSLPYPSPPTLPPRED